MISPEVAYIIYNIVTKEILYQNYYNISEEDVKEIAAWYAMCWGVDSVRLVSIRSYDSIENYDRTWISEKGKWIEEKLGKNENVFNISFGS